MSENLNVNSNLHKSSNGLEDFGRDPGGDIMPFYEEVTITKTEVKEEWCDFDMSLDNMVFANVKEEHISSPEYKLEFMKSTEQSLNENLDFGNCASRGTNLQENKYRCELCHSEFVNEIYLRLHYEQCPFAKRKLTKNAVHLKGNDTDKKYKCAHCTFSTTIKLNFIRHGRIHVKSKSLHKWKYKDCKCTLEQKDFCECNPCGYEGTSKNILDRHILVRHCVEPRKYKCKDCLYITYWKANLVQHLHTHTNDKPFKCTHKNCKCTHEQKESCECDMCEYAANQKQALQKHILVKHSTESKKYNCSDCKYASNIKGALVQHVRIHTNEKAFKCKYKNCKCTPKEKELCECNPCGFASHNKSHLNRHILMRHSAEPKNYKCKLCQYATHWKPTLIQHMDIHSNARPYKCTYKNCKCADEQKECCGCDMCGYAAKQKRTLQKHVLLIHNKNQRSKSVVIANTPLITKRI